MDVNEKIVITWLQSCKRIFTIPDIEYDNFHSSIDILGVDLLNNEILDIEVKSKFRITINESSKKQNGYQHIYKQLSSTKRNEMINKALPNKHKFKVRKIFITTKRFLTVNKFEYWVKKFEDDGITIWFFDAIVNDLSQMSLMLNKANDEILQTLRMFNQLKKVIKK